MKRNTRLFFRTVKITAVILLCLVIGIIGTARAYESIRQVGFGEYRRAVEINEDGFKLFDFEIPF